MARRDYGIDLLKSISILGVLIIHSCQYGDPVASVPWLSNVFWGSLARASVPLFLMCSGALFLSRSVSIRKLFTRSIPHIAAAMFFWGMAYKVFHLEPAGWTPGNLLHALKEVLLFNQEFHLYYLQITLLVYLFLPMTGLITKHATRRQLEYGLLLWFLFGILYPTVRPFWPFRLLDMQIPNYQINIAYASIGYGVLGFYLKQYPLKRGAALASALAGFLTVFCGTVFLSVRAGRLEELFLGGMTVGTALLAAGVFSLCAGAESPGGGMEGVVTYLSKASFCVYLTHVFLNHLRLERGFALPLPPLVGVPLLALGTLGVSLLGYEVLRRVPGVRRWLI